MTDQMIDPPEHLRIPMTKEGYGPAEGADVDHWGCWCVDGVDCTADAQIWGMDFHGINRRVGNE